MTPMTHTPSVAAAIMVAVLEERGWIFSLNDEGQLTVIIGDDLPGLSQSILLAVLGSLAQELEALAVLQKGVAD